MRFITFLLLYLLPHTFYGQMPNDSLSVSDSTKTNPCAFECEQFKPRHLILPTAMVAVGAWGVGNPWATKMRYRLKDKLAEWRNGVYIHTDDYAQYLPILSFMTFDYLGVKAKHNLAERTAILATSYLAMGIVVNTIKCTVNEMRPDNSTNNSFPSGHTATAFMGVELFRLEYGNKWGIPAYSIAAAVAFLRLHNERHWLNDVIAGAGIGILSAKFGYWMLPVNRKIFGLKKKESLSILPNYFPENKALGVGLSACF